jgi:hypothetical protein
VPTALSETAATILGRMVPDIRYGLPDLRQLAPELSAEALREIMHELWVERQVERSGDAGWRVARSTRPARSSNDSGTHPTAGTVKPEDLFDHDSFSTFFK